MVSIDRFGAIRASMAAKSICLYANATVKSETTLIAAKQPLSLSHIHMPQKLAINGSPKPKAQNFGCALARSGVAMRCDQAL
jgi:hypothetical protein